MRAPALLPLLTSLAFAACHSAKPSSPAPIPATGAYRLVSIDGHSLPYAPMHDGRTGPLVRASTFDMREDGTFVSTGSYGLPSGETLSRDFSGTFTRQDSLLTFTWNGAGQTTATYDGDQFTMVNEGIRFTYRRVASSAPE